MDKYLICIMGKSGVGKDTIYEALLTDSSLELSPYVLYTTRPMRVGETDGKTYHFVTEEQWDSLHVIEQREYNTAQGLWRYGSVYLDGKDFLCVTTPTAYLKYTEAYKNVLPIYIEVDHQTRLRRATDRENMQPAPDFKELKRRFDADESDFSDEVLLSCGIKKRFVNDDFQRCYGEIKREIQTVLGKAIT